jgi:hypothetical protein
MASAGMSCRVMAAMASAGVVRALMAAHHGEKEHPSSEDQRRQIDPEHARILTPACRDASGTAIPKRLQYGIDSSTRRVETVRA